jgi:hypothetical protein
VQTSPRLFDDASAAALIGLLDKKPASARGRRTEAVLVFSLSQGRSRESTRIPSSSEHIMPAHPWSILTTFRKYQEADTFSPTVRARPIELIEARLKRAEQRYKENYMKGART